MILLNAAHTFVRPVELHMTSALFFLSQVAIMAGCMVLLSQWLHWMLTPSSSPAPLSFRYDRCNITFVHAPILPFSASPNVFVPVSLDWEDAGCLLVSLGNFLFFHLCCFLLTLALLVVFGTFLVMALFLLDLIHYFWRGVIDGLTKE